MASPIDIKKRTEFFLRDLHARERMRLGWYRQWRFPEESLRQLRQRKAHHTAFLLELLRKQGMKTAWYAGFFYGMGHIFGLFSALLPKKWAESLESRLETWMLIRYRRYFRAMTLDASLRSMIESVQLHRLDHNEPTPDALKLVATFIREQEQVIATAQGVPSV